MTDQEYIDEQLEAQDDKQDDELFKTVKRIETGIEEIYKLLQAQKPAQGKPTDAMCNEHGVEMRSAVSKKTGKPYGFHRNEGGQICFGRGYQS